MKAFWDELEPRSRLDASRAATALLLLCAVVTGVFGVVTPPPGGIGDEVAALGVPVVLVGFAVALYRTTGKGPSLVWAAAPVAGVILVTVLDAATSDASAAGQVFFCMPMLYAASSLRSRVAYTVLVLALAGDATVTFALLSPVRALTDLCYVGATLAAITVLLVRAGQQQDRLTTELRRQAAIDPLTGLVTRRVLDDAADAALANAAGGGGTVLILADVDRFKTINDTHGHPTGDAALVHVAAILRGHCRAEDVLSRLGGDEIALLIPGCTAERGVERAEVIATAVRDTPLPTLDGPIDLSVSVGVAHADRDAADFRTLYAHADAVLYDAKRHRPGHVGRTVPDRAAGPAPVPLEPVLLATVPVATAPVAVAAALVEAATS